MAVKGLFLSAAKISSETNQMSVLVFLATVWGTIWEDTTRETRKGRIAAGT